MPNHQLKIADLSNIPIGNVIKLVSNLFDKENNCFIMKSCNLLETKVKTKKDTRVRSQSMTMVKNIH